VVFCAPKGGTGRTTLAINTALAVRMATSKPVALVDADFAAPALDVALNLPSERNVTDLLPRLSRLDEDLISGVLAVHASGLQVLLAPPPADLSAPISLPQVQHILVVLQRMFPWVFVDLGLPMDETAFAFLDSADRIVLSVLPEMVGLRNTRLMLDQLQDLGYREDKVCLVLNRASMKGGVSQSDIEERLRVRVNHRIPDDQPAATQSINRGVPLVANRQRGTVARAMRNLAQQLIDGLEPEETTKTRGSLINRWRTRPSSADS
jgi:pilus assembly protein CpaE